MKTNLKIVRSTICFLATIFLLSDCSVIHPGQVGLDVHYGKIKNKILLPGPHHIKIFGTKIIRLNTRIHEYADKIKFPTQEGIEVTSEMILLYHFIPDSIKSIYLQFGTDYQNTVIVNNLITALRQTGLNYKATQLIIERSALENSIKEKLILSIGKYGFVVDLLMIKDIDLPADVVSTILAKLQAERLLIEADAVRKQQEIISSTLTDRIIRYKALEITRDLVKSSNTKVIIMDGKSPVIIDGKDK